MQRLSGLPCTRNQESIRYKSVEEQKKEFARRGINNLNNQMLKKALAPNRYVMYWSDIRVILLNNKRHPVTGLAKTRQYLTRKSQDISETLAYTDDSEFKFNEYDKRSLQNSLQTIEKLKRREYKKHAIELDGLLSQLGI